MSNPGGHLTDGGQLLGPQHLALALVQALEHLFNLREDALHQGCRGRRRVVVLDRDRPQVAGKQAGRVADAHAELDHRLMHSSRHRVAKQPAGQRRTQADHHQAPRQAIDKTASGFVRGTDLPCIVVQQTRARQQHILFQLQRQPPIEVF